VACSFCGDHERGVHNLLDSRCRIQKAKENLEWATLVSVAYTYEVPSWANDSSMRATLFARALYLVRNQIQTDVEVEVIPARIDPKNGMVVEYIFIAR